MFSSVASKFPFFKLAVVESFNADSSDDGSGDMTGRLRLSDGRVMPFSYYDWVEPFRGYDPGEISYHCDFDLGGGKDFSGRRGVFSWPAAGEVVMANVQDEAVRLWTWPQKILRIDGSRYPELFCVVDCSNESQDGIERIRNEVHFTFGPQAVYAGPAPINFLKGSDVPEQYLVQRWDRVCCRVVFEK